MLNRKKILAALALAGVVVTTSPAVTPMAAEPVTQTAADTAGSTDPDKTVDDRLTEAWLKTCAKVKKTASKKSGKYRIGKYITIKIGKKRYSFRQDASGFVSLCLNAAGITNKAYSSRSFAKADIKGLERIEWDGTTADLMPGDILIFDGNTAIFTEMKNDKMMGYCWGSSRSAKTKKTTIITGKKPVCILRLEKADTGVLKTAAAPVR